MKSRSSALWHRCTWRGEAGFITAPCRRKCRDLKGMFLLCIISVFSGQCCLAACLCSEQDRPCWAAKKKPPAAPRRLSDPQPSQLFSITFKLLFTRSQRTDWKFDFLPLASSFLFILKIPSPVLSIYQPSKCSKHLFLSVDVWLFCLWPLRFFFFILSSNGKNLSPSVQYICYKHLQWTMPSLKIGEIKLDSWEKQKEAGSLRRLNFMYILEVLFVCALLLELCRFFFFSFQIWKTQTLDFEKEQSCTKWFFFSFLYLFLCVFIFFQSVTKKMKLHLQFFKRAPLQNWCECVFLGFFFFARRWRGGKENGRTCYSC